jgi:hypothetical protein
MRVAFVMTVGFANAGGTADEAVDRIVNSPEGQARVAEGRMKIISALHEIVAGRVRLLSRDTP